MKYVLSIHFEGGTTVRYEIEKEKSKAILALYAKYLANANESKDGEEAFISSSTKSGDIHFVCFQPKKILAINISRVDDSNNIQDEIRVKQSQLLDEQITYWRNRNKDDSEPWKDGY